MPKAIRPIRVEGDIAYITLTLGYEAVIDAADVNLVNHVNWHASKGTRTVYARATIWDGERHRKVLIHRLLTGEPISMEVDHIDSNGLNNRRCNLRVASGFQNQQNKRIGRKNTSGYKGVSFHKPRGKWQAQINANGTRTFLGFHATPEAAHEAYRSASAKLHGEFSRIG